MKIQFIGTGSIDSNSRSASTLINGEILIDCGNGIVKTFKQMGTDIRNIRAILITHLHGDHTFDLPFFINDLHNYVDTLENEVNIYGPEGTIDMVQDLYKLAFREDGIKKAQEAKIKIHEFGKLINLKVDKYWVSSYEVDHGGFPNCYGYTVTKDKSTIGFSGDSLYCESVKEIVDRSSISVLDCSKEIGGFNHMGLDNIKKICEENPEKKIVTTHMKDLTREKAKELSIPNLIVPEDGDIIEM